MRRHGTSKGPSEATYFAMDSKVFDQKLKDSLAIMVTRVRIWVTFRPPIVSVVPCHHIDLILNKKFQPKRIRWVDLLLIKLSIRIKKDDRGLLQVLRPIPIHLFHGQHFLIIVRKEHTVQIGAILTLHHERPAIKVILEHLFQLIIGMKKIDEFQPKAIASTANIVDWLICLSNYISELDCKLFKLRE